MKFPWSKGDDSNERKFKRGVNDMTPDETDHDPQMLDTLLNAVCVQPTEITSFRVVLDGDETSDPQQNAPRPGIVLTLGVTRTVPGYVIPLHLPIGLARDSVVALHDMLSRYLADGGHYHWYTYQEVKRVEDVDMTGDLDDVGIQVPDTLEGMD